MATIDSKGDENFKVSSKTVMVKEKLLNGGDDIKLSVLDIEITGVLEADQCISDFFGNEKILQNFFKEKQNTDIVDAEVVSDTGDDEIMSEKRYFESQDLSILEADNLSEGFEEKPKPAKRSLASYNLSILEADNLSEAKPKPAKRNFESQDSSILEADNLSVHDKSSFENHNTDFVEASQPSVPLNVELIHKKTTYESQNIDILEADNISDTFNVEIPDKPNHGIHELEMETNDLQNLVNDGLSYAKLLLDERNEIETQRILGILEYDQSSLDYFEPIESKTFHDEVSPQNNKYLEQIKEIETLMQKGKSDTALKICNETIKKLNKDLDDKEIAYTFYCKRAAIHSEQEKYIEALSDYDYLLQIPRLRSYHDEIRHATRTVERDLVKSIFDETIQKCPKCLDYKENQLTMINNFITKLQYRNELRKPNRDVLLLIAWMEHVQLHFDCKEFEITLTISLQALHKYPKETRLYSFIAKCHYNLRQFEQAKINYRKAQSMTHDKKDVFENEIQMCERQIKIRNFEKQLDKINIYWEQEKFDDANTFLTNLLSSFDMNYLELNSELKERALFYTARVLLQLEEYDKAKNYCNEILLTNNQHSEARFLHGKINFAQQKYEEAIDDFDKLPNKFAEKEEAKMLRLDAEKELYRQKINLPRQDSVLAVDMHQIKLNEDIPTNDHTAKKKCCCKTCRCTIS